MHIRPATKADAREVAKVQVDTWHTTYKGIVPDEYLVTMTYRSREQKWKSIIESSLVFVAETSKGKIVGFSNGGKERTGKYPGYNGEIYAIYLLKDFQRKGLGKLLLKPLVREFQNQGIVSMVVLVLAENKSKSFYETLGAHEIGSSEIEVKGKMLLEVVYGWKDFKEFLDKVEEK